MEPELFFCFFGFCILDFKVLLAVKFFSTSIFFRKVFPMAGVDGAIFLEDFLITSPWLAAVFFV